MGLRPRGAKALSLEQHVERSGEPPYEQAIEELEHIVRQLESGDLPLDASLQLYERGVALARLCTRQLDAADARLSVLATDDNGHPVIRPLEGVGG